MCTEPPPCQISLLVLDYKDGGFSMNVNDYGRRAWRLLYPILIYFAVYYVIYLAGGIIGMTTSFLDMERTGAEMDIYVLIERTYQQITNYSLPMSLCAAVIMIPILLLLIRMDRKASQTSVRYETVPAPFYILCGLLGAAACLAINGMLMISRLTTLLAPELEQVGDSLYHGQYLFELLVTGIAMPVVEELLFRGIIQNRLREYLKPGHAIILSAVLFGLYHGNTLQVIYALLIGLLLGYVYEKFHNIAAPIALHCFANIVSVVGSETPLLEKLFSQENEIGLMLMTGICCAAVLLFLYLVNENVNPSQVRNVQEDNRGEL